MKKRLLYLVTCCLTIFGYSQGLNTLLVYATTPINATDVKAKLDGTIYFDNVDLFDAALGTPDVSLLLQYESVLVFNDGTYNNTVALGDSLAKYIDLGGGVVDVPYLGIEPAGNFTNYQLYSSHTISTVGPASLGPIFIPGHPIMDSVSTFAYFGFIHSISPKIGTDFIVGFNFPEFMVLGQENVGPGLTRRATLNFWPASTDVTAFGWTSTTDGDLIIANALKWVSGQDILPPEYCASQPRRNRFEWINRVELGEDIDNTSGRNSSRYGDYTDDILEVDTNEVVTVNLTPGYRRRVYTEYWRIWADWNYDGDFDDAGEKVFEKNGKNMQSGSFTVPASTNINDLRIRVSMRWKRYAPSCGNFSNGEVEDYTIRVSGNTIILPPEPEFDFARLSQEPTYSEESFTEIGELYTNPIPSGEAIAGVVRVNKPGNKMFYLRNTLGQLVKAVPVNCLEEESEFTIPSSGLQSGIYFLTIDTDQEATKIIIN